MPPQVAPRFAKPCVVLMQAFATSGAAAPTNMAANQADLPIQTTLTHVQLHIGGTTGCLPNQTWSEAAGGCAAPAPPPDPPALSLVSYSCKITSTSGYTGQGRNAGAIRPSGDPRLDAVITAKAQAKSESPGADLQAAALSRQCTQTLRLTISSCKTETFERSVRLSAGSTVVTATSRRSGSLWDLKGTLRQPDSQLASRAAWSHESTQDDCPPRPGDPAIGYVFTFRAGLICTSTDSGYFYTPSRTGSHCVTNSVRNAIIGGYRNHGYGRCPEAGGYRYWLDDVALVAAQTGGDRQCSAGLNKALQNIDSNIQREDGSWDCQAEANRRWPPARSVLAVMVPRTGRDCRVTGYR